MHLQEFLSRLEGVKTCKGDHIAKCPVHGDRHQSLSIKDKDGKILLYCHAGCTVEDIVSTLGLDMKDLFLENKHTELRWEDRIECTYNYTDQKGKLVFQSVRLFSPKDFRQRHFCPDGKDGWSWGLALSKEKKCHCQPVKTFPYRLPELIEAVKTGKIVFIVEGEKDADRLINLGYFATTNPMGAGKWRDNYSKWFIGAFAIIIPDNDLPGQEHASDVKVSLYQKANSIKILNLPGLPPKGDMSDWLDAGHTKEELEKLIAETPFWEPGQGEEGNVLDEETRNKVINLTDMGNSRRLVMRHGENIRYCHRWEKWLIWDGKRWMIDDTGEIVEKAKETVHAIYDELERIDDPDLQKKIAKHAKASQARDRINAMIALARSEPGIPVLHSRLDSNPWLLNLLNGTIDLKTGEIRPHEKTDLITKLAPVKFEGMDAKCDQWMDFLYKIMGGDVDMIQFIKRSVGYSMSGDTSERCLFIMHGGGRNGKSVFLETIRDRLSNGDDDGRYAMRTPTETLMVKKNDGGIPNDIARLKGARFVYASESEEGRRLAEAMIKDLTGGEHVSARFMRGEFFDFRPEFKIWLGTNHKPLIRGSDPAIWDRIHLIPFEVRIKDEEMIQRHILMEIFQEEASGILAWAIEGCTEWIKNGLKPPAKVRAATASYRSEMDVLGEFISQSCLTGKDANGNNYEVKGGLLHEEYRKWCEANGERWMKPVSLSLRLQERGFEVIRLKDGSRGWSGIGLSAKSF